MAFPSAYARIAAILFTTAFMSNKTSNPSRKRFGKKDLIATLIIFLAIAGVGYTMLGPDIEEGDVVSDLDPMTGVPYSGTWSFKLDIGNTGPANLSVSPNGSYVLMSADGQNLFFYRTGSMVPYTYKTNQRPFGLRDGEDNPVTGYAYFEFTAVDSDVIDGILHHSTQPGGMTTKSFHMELVDLELPDMEWIDLLAGDWNLEYNAVESDCEGDDVGSFPGLPESFSLEPEYDLDTGEASGDMWLDFGNDDIFISPGEDPNSYFQNDAAIDIGNPLSPEGDLLLDFEDDSFTAEFNFFGTGEDTMEGYVEITGSNGCGYTVGFSGSI